MIQLRVRLIRLVRLVMLVVLRRIFGVEDIRLGFVVFRPSLELVWLAHIDFEFRFEKQLHSFRIIVLFSLD